MELAPVDIAEIAESIDEFLGAALLRSTLCFGAFSAIGGFRVLVDELPLVLGVMRGSETLLEEPLDTLVDCSILFEVSYEHMTVGCDLGIR